MEKTDTTLYEIMKQKFGITIVNDTPNSYENYIKLDDSTFSKVNAAFQSMPQILKGIQDTQHYAGTYKVIYDKGLGVLQKASNNDYYRANIVAPGQNNNIKAQALLQEIGPSDAMKISNLAFSAFSIASVITNQYFMKRIDDKLASIEKKVYEIQRFLEIDKESQLWADGEFLKETRKNVPFILENDVYRQATLINVQAIRRTALSNIKLYYEQLSDLKKLFNLKDKDKDSKDKIMLYQGYFPKYWYSIYLYETAYSLEVILSQITDASFLKNIMDDMEKVVDMFEKNFKTINIEVYNYINEVKALKANVVPAKIIKSVGMLLQISNGPISPVFAGYILDKSGDALERHEKISKQTKKEEVIRELESCVKPYSDLHPLKMQMEDIKRIDAIYNHALEIIIDNDKECAYLKYNS
ncbi:hypothetical protein [[Clostridium] innocuum]|uniref:hypothetical protein n=1 Tax=Clostridium innocuum TaxID=1522 RepID=UPI000D6B3A44|nr:hypothetical protein [[Clostridium] innocuum]PWJ12840.1 hypothetical protein ATF84_11390 [[Clostridium] innocuum]SSA47232.1 hypothetical protein SAMN04487929_11390 [[Clostridium] innocuum]